MVTTAFLTKLFFVTAAYLHTEHILVAVDSIVFGVDGNKLRVLLFRREVEPASGEWSLIGSFVNKNESLDDAGKRILYSLTGLEDIYMEQLYCFGDTKRDPGDRVISVAYWSLIDITNNDLEFEYDNHQSKWFAVDDLPELILDHGQMIEKAMERLRRKTRFEPIAFELLPKEFTMKQLMNVYEAIYGEELDDRNFRRKITQKDLVKRLAKKDWSTSKKGSYLYVLNKDFHKTLNSDFLY